VPIVIWIMIGYFETTPMELEESALIGRRHPLAGVPLRRTADRAAGHRRRVHPGGVFSWNTFVFGIVLAGRETRHPARGGLQHDFLHQLSWGPLAAAALIVTLPVLLLTVFAQRQIVRG